MEHLSKLNLNYKVNFPHGIKMVVGIVVNAHCKKLGELLDGFHMIFVCYSDHFF